MAETEQDYTNLYENLMGPEEERAAEAEFMSNIRDPTSSVVSDAATWGKFLMKNPGIMLNQPTTISETKNTRRAMDAIKEFDRYQRTKRHRHRTEAKAPFYPMTVGYGNGQYMKLSPDHMNQMSEALSHHVKVMPTDAKGEMRLYDGKLDSAELPYIISSEVMGENGLETQIGAEFMANGAEYQNLIKQGTLPNTVQGADGAPVVNGFKMSVPKACQLLVQSCIAANAADETVNFYNGAPSKGLRAPISSCAVQEMTDQLNVVSKDTKNALTPFAPSADLFSHGVLPKHMVGRQVNVYADLKDLCGDVGGMLKKASIGSKATMAMDEAAIEKVKTAITAEIGGALGATAAVHGYETNDVKKFALYNGNGFYGNDSSVFNVDSTAVQTGKIGAESIGYNKHDCAHMMVRAEIGDHVVDVPIVPSSKNAAGQYKVRVGAAAVTNVTDNCTFAHSALHDVDTHTFTSSDGKVLASFY